MPRDSHREPSQTKETLAEIAHHQGAIDSAEVVLLEGRHPAVLELARAVIDAQSAEIDQLESWVEAWT